jgi:Saccharopine dehydrogenase NADP binding domain
VPISRIVVAGAGGHTGKFVVEQLRNRGATPIPATRTGRFQALGQREQPCHTIDFADADHLDWLMRQGDAVINCAGPFFDTSSPCAEAAIRAAIPYLDVTAEQMTAKLLFETLDRRARDAGVTIVPAMAFFGGLADLLVTALVRESAKIEAIEIAVGLDFWHPTPGTRLTGKRNTFPRVIVREGQLVPIPATPPAKRWDFPGPLGEQPVTCVALSEIVLISRHIQAESITSFMNHAPLENLKSPATPPPHAVETSGRSAQKFAMDVRVVADGGHARATATGRDIYAVSAALVVDGCLALLNGGTAVPGVRAPGELYEPRAFLASLASEIDVGFTTL